MRTEIDAWYVDLPAARGGLQHAGRRSRIRRRATGECVDRIEAKTAGDAALGFPVKTTTTITTGEADKQETSHDLL